MRSISFHFGEIASPYGENFSLKGEKLIYRSPSFYIFLYAFNVFLFGV
jgi:hypothetical protein